MTIRGSSRCNEATRDCIELKFFNPTLHFMRIKGAPLTAILAKHDNLNIVNFYLITCRRSVDLNPLFTHNFGKVVSSNAVKVNSTIHAISSANIANRIGSSLYLKL